MLLLGLAAGGCWQKQEEKKQTKQTMQTNKADLNADFAAQEAEAIAMLEALINGNGGNESLAWSPEQLDQAAEDLIAELVQAEHAALAEASGMGSDLFDEKAFSLDEENAQFAWTEEDDLDAVDADGDFTEGSQA